MSGGYRWDERAACAGMDTEAFYPGGDDTRLSPRSALPPASACRRCPVSAQCLAEALRWPRAARWGIWGGWCFADDRPAVDVLALAGFGPKRSPPDAPHAATDSDEEVKGNATEGVA